jgi:hypothetical protein
VSEKILVLDHRSNELDDSFSLSLRLKRPWSLQPDEDQNLSTYFVGPVWAGIEQEPCTTALGACSDGKRSNFSKIDRR